MKPISLEYGIYYHLFALVISSASSKSNCTHFESRSMHQGYLGVGGRRFGRCISKFLELGRCIFSKNGNFFEIFEMYLPSKPPKSLFIAFLLTKQGCIILLSIRIMVTTTPTEILQIEPFSVRENANKI